MRRLFGVIILSVLTMVPGLAIARTLGTVAPQNADLGHQLLLRFFGETSDARASLAAAYGDVQSESPLRNLALSVAGPQNVIAAWDEPAVVPTFAVADEEDTSDVPLFNAAARYENAFSAPLAGQYGTTTVPASTNQADFVASPSGSTFVSGQYRPIAPARSASTSLGNAATAAQTQGDSGLAFSQAPATNSWTSAASNAATLGPVNLRARFDSTQVSQPQSALTDGGYGAGADVNVRAGHRNLDFTVSSDYERLMRNDTSGVAALSPSSNWQLPGGDVPLVVPNYADMSRVSLGAALAVPVVNNLTLNLNVASDRMLGAYGLPGVNNLDATDNSYGGRLTFAIPHSTSSLSISAQQLHYQDNLMPSDTYSQTRENVNFTVKF
ncbi:MAG TPA: hypothetical protein VGK84_03525 [Candidatus Tumulicola sp.]